MLEITIRKYIPLFLVTPGKKIITIVKGGGQKVMIEIIISVNDENDGRPLSQILVKG